MSEETPHPNQPESNPKIAIRLLGPFTMTVDSNESIRLSGKMLALFAYLLIYGQQSRQALTEILWSATPLERRNSRLSDTVYRLRRTLSGRFLSADETYISLDFAETPDVDVWRFNVLCQEKDSFSLKQAVELYRDDLLPECDEEWLLARRVALQDQLFNCLLLLGEQAESEQDLPSATHYYHQLIERNPLFEGGHRGLMRAQARAGQITRALETFRNLTELLQSEVGVAPSRESTMLANTLERELDTSHVAPPFVGRREERARLLRALELAGAGQGGLVILLGEAGMGKSRLLQELERAASWRSWRVQWGRSEDMVLPAPYVPLADALRQALPAARQQQLAQQLPAATLANAAPLLSPLADDATLKPEKSAIAPALARILQALGQLLPHLFLLDDVQWADPEIWPLLVSLHRELANSSVLMVLAGRNDELEVQTEAWTTIADWDAAGVPIVQLQGLSSDELTELAAGELDARTLSRLLDASGGNPLIALTLLSEQNQLEDDQSLLIDNVLRQRFKRLSDPAGRALQLAAALGSQFAYADWSSLQTIVPLTTFPEVASELERAGLLQLTEHDYRFAHDTLRTLVYSDTPADRRQTLHTQILDKWLTEPNKNPLSLLHHARQAQSAQHIGPLAIDAGELQLRHLAHRGAATHFALALETLPPDAISERYRAHRGRIQTSSVLRGDDTHNEDTKALLHLANTLADPAKQADASHLRAYYLWSIGEQEEAATIAKQGLQYSASLDDNIIEADLEQTMARIRRNQGNYEAALVHMTRAHKLYLAAADISGAASALDKLGNLAYEAGDYALAAERHQAAAAQFAGLGDSLREARVLNGLALAIRASGDIAAARQIHEQLVITGEQLNDKSMIWVQQTNLGNIAHEISDFDKAIHWYTTAVALLRQIKEPYGLSLVLGNLGDTKYQLQRFREAYNHHREALAINQARGFRRGEGNSRQGIGITLLEEGQLEEALENLQLADEIWLELNQNRKQIDTRAALAIVYLSMNNHQEAEAKIADALAHVAELPELTTSWRTVHFAAYRVFAATGRSTQAHEHLARAVNALEKITLNMPQADQQRLYRSTINRRIIDALTALSTRQTVQLARQDAPRGRTLTADELCTVTWTTASIVDDTISNAAARRRAVIVRLIKEAAEQGGAPTDADLAAALGVSRRTIIRDMANLSESDVQLTRGR